MLKTRIANRAMKAGLILLAGVVLFLCILAGERVLWPQAFDAVGRAFYRAAYFIILPFRGIVAIFLPRTAHHWSILHMILSTFGTPVFLYAGWRLYRRLRAGVRSRPADDEPGAAVISRREFLTRSAGYAAVGAGAILWGSGVYVEPELVKVRRYTSAIKGLPAELDGLRLIHVSDTHYGPFISMSYLERVARIVNDLKGDLVVLTGDYVHWTPASVRPGISVLGNLAAKHGAVAVLGNHEHWEGTDYCKSVFSEVGIPLLDNTHCFLSASGISNEAGENAGLCVAGLGDLWEDRVSYEDALSGVPESVPRIVLAHNPDTAEQDRAGCRVDLMLCGHTHGGQVRIPFVPSIFAPIRHKGKYLGGLCSGPGFPVIVSRGAGLAGIPMRFGVPPEIGEITLRCAERGTIASRS